jgi:hypothetical protein
LGDVFGDVELFGHVVFAVCEVVADGAAAEAVCA